jgi:hypothetical protein
VHICKSTGQRSTCYGTYHLDSYKNTNHRINNLKETQQLKILSIVTINNLFGAKFYKFFDNVNMLFKNVRLVCSSVLCFPLICRVHPMDQISIKTPNPKCRLYLCWRYSQPLVHLPPPPPHPCVYRGVFIQCVKGGEGIGASDRKTPAAKYLYWSIFLKSRHLGFDVFIDIWSMLVAPPRDPRAWEMLKRISLKYADLFYISCVRVYIFVYFSNITE